MAAEDVSAAISRAGILRWLEAFAVAVGENKDHLTRLDAAIGDGDHGANLDRGMRAVLLRLPDVAERDIGATLKLMGMSLVSTVGGASGPLYGTLFLRMGDATAGKLALTLEDWTAALRMGVDGVATRGKAHPGDKTMLDALAPAVEALDASQAQGTSIAEALRRSALAAERGAADTIPLVARRGRASYLGERSAGHQDPGATSAFLLLRAAAEGLCRAT
ncbi:MAG TPA: dihydroxyacetone kinase subunit DhaL [Chloroflexota bacterium]|nr:dihydroxyacetone kinase subunit DhaL [Chloroflexota bacterium]